MDDSDQKHLAWFLGPKAEHSELLEKLVVSVIRDYVHWRRNYFPADRFLINATAQKQWEDLHDELSQRLMEMTAQLRRNFPFYSPRYIAHQLSDPTLPGTIGYLAGLLYNANNVTPEAAPVTVDWEIEACSDLLRMLGYTPPPEPPAHGMEAQYARSIEQEFGWCHTTLGGTTANLEALWVARVVKYFPLAARDAANAHGIPVEVKRADGFADDITKHDEIDLLNVKPNESIYLLARFVDAVRRHYDLPALEASEKALQLLNESAYAPSKSLGAAFSKYPPVIFVSGAAHYSVRKAADIVGIGRDNVELVDMDPLFRMDPRDLSVKLQHARKAGRAIVAVIAIAGTTEEGAVDPIHRILDVRRDFESSHRASFWLHVDAAWGGYFRTLFCLEPNEQLSYVCKKLGKLVGYPFNGEIGRWQSGLVEELERRLKSRGGEGDSVPPAEPDSGGRRVTPIAKMRAAAESADSEAYVRHLQQLLLNFGAPFGLETLTPADVRLTLEDRIDIVNSYVSDSIELQMDAYRKKLDIAWGGVETCSALIAFEKADSITVDPHKMGYVPYPCGAIAFRNDRVRHFILQKAPYITSFKQNALVHVPPKHLEHQTPGSTLTDGKVVIEAFAPFIVEGSRPGATAASLWLATKTIPLTMTRHGAIVRASVLAARELHEWLVHWNQIMDTNGVDTRYEFVPVTHLPPQTNIVIFVVKPKVSTSLAELNQVTEAVYRNFAIEAELGDREYSYSQPFFLSRTRCSIPEYEHSTLGELFKRCSIRDSKKNYHAHGLTVLRAVVMNPYIHPARTAGVHNVMRDFVRELARASRDAVADLESALGG